MKFNTVGTALITAVTAGLVLAGCGSDDNTGAGSGADSFTMTPGALCSGKNAVTAEGSTAQQNAIALFNRAWGKLCPGKNLSYNPTGSGAGREQFIAGHVDFAGSESPLSPEQVEVAAKRCNGNPAWHLPLVFGPVALAYHIEGVDKLVLNGDLLARIFNGAITMWNDPAITFLNPGVALPDLKITPVYRSDSSGTTDNFQKYLMATASLSWGRGAGSEFQGGVGEGVQKSAGMVQAVRTTPGALGYIEKGFVDQARLPSALLDSGSGPVALADDSAALALNSIRFESDGNDLRVDLNSVYGARLPGAYPLVLITYEIVCAQGYGPETAAATKSFLSAAADGGQADLPDAGYVPLSDKLKQRLVAAIDAIQ